MFAKNRGKSISIDSKNADKKKYVRKVSASAITRWRLWLFRIIAVTVVPALFFLFLESGLRIIGYGYSASTTAKCKLNGKDFYRNNWKFGWRFYPEKNKSRFFLKAPRPAKARPLFLAKLRANRLRRPLIIAF